MHRGTEVVLQFDDTAEQWLVSSVAGVELCRRPLTQFSAQTLRDLDHYQHPRQ